uniref:Uncharacterized protein n=1 Tax=Parascaris equorum TaxID=6256 RepID=A0A914RRP2_PAREQ
MSSHLGDVCWPVRQLYLWQHQGQVPRMACSLPERRRTTHCVHRRRSRTHPDPSRASAASSSHHENLPSHGVPSNDYTTSDLDQHPNRVINRSTVDSSI